MIITTVNRQGSPYYWQIKKLNKMKYKDTEVLIGLFHYSQEG